MILKRDANVNAILGLLYKSTELQCNFNANIVAIADGKPRQLGLIEILDYYVNYQQSVILNRTKYDLEACLKKEHILEGLLIAINNIDEVVRIIKQSKSTNDAKVSLMSAFSLTDVQAQAILDMRLARLTSLEVNKLVYELERLKLLIKKYTAIIKSPILQMQTVKEEILKIRDEYGSDRRTHFLNSEDLAVEVDMKVEEVVQDEYVILSAANTLKAIQPKSYNLATKTLSANATLYEIPKFIVQTNSNGVVYLFTNKGNCHKVIVKDIELGKYKDKGFNLDHFIKHIENDEVVVSMLELREDDKIVFTTELGMIKVSDASEYFVSKQSIGAIKLKDKDSLVNVEILSENKTLVLATRDFMMVNVEVNDIASTGRLTGGVKGMSLTGKDVVVGTTLVGKDDLVAVITSNSFAKLLKVADIEISQRNRKGLKCMSYKGIAECLSVTVASDKLNYVLHGEKLNLVQNKDLKVNNRTSAGASLVSSKTGEKISNIYRYTLI